MKRIYHSLYRLPGYNFSIIVSYMIIIAQSSFFDYILGVKIMAGIADSDIV
jgi:hypothetical protein